MWPTGRGLRTSILALHATDKCIDRRMADVEGKYMTFDSGPFGQCRLLYMKVRSPFFYVGDM
jgi:hypothetical protein